ncbi:RDD family protein [Candidatus Bathyarchaeota archaeon]|nr:MAG: RDD family protein [Candidatus Bathyarchaeota archaeon]
MPYCVKCGEKIPEDAAFCPNCGTPVRADLRTRFETADWGERFVAWIIDMIVVGLFLAPFKWYLAWIKFTGLMTPHFLKFIPFVDLGFDNIAYFLYWTVTEGIYGQSIGKMIMKLKITRLNSGRIAMLQAAVESIGKAFLLPLDCLIGWILYSDKKQRLFNHISETVVIKIRH